MSGRGGTLREKHRDRRDLRERGRDREIVNSDKIQLYRGLDITTNKLPLPERLSVPHHLAGQVVSGITNRRKVPMLVGAMVADRFEPGSDASLSAECVDVSMAVLTEYLSKRVDEMLDSGMFEELAEFSTQQPEQRRLSSSSQNGCFQGEPQCS